MIEARNAIADTSPEGGHGGRTANACEQEIRTRVVAQLDRRLAHLRDRQSAFCEILPGYRRALLEVRDPVRDHLIERIPP